MSNKQFDYPVVSRRSSILYENRKENGVHETEWAKAYRSEKNRYGSTTLYGTAKIGMYTFSGESVMNYIFDYCTDELVTEELAEQTGWYYYHHYRYTDTYLTSQKVHYENTMDDWLDRGMQRITYDAKSKDGLECTLFGYLNEDGSVSSTEEYEMQYELGIMTKEEFLDKY